MKLCFMAILLICWMIPARAQQLQIGDQVPDLELEYVKNNKIERTPVSALKGKIVILDFWSIYCSSCVQEFPKLEEMQNEHNKSVQVFLVTKDTKEKVDKWIQGSKKAKNVKLPLVLGDTVLSRLFPYSMVPHQVWLDTNGKVLAITDSWNTNAANLKKVLSGDRSFFTQKNDVIDYDYQQPLWMEGNGRFATHLQYYSFLMDRVDGIGGGMGVRTVTDSVTKTRKIVRFYATNVSLLQLLETAYGGYWGVNPFRYMNRVVVDLTHPEKVLRPADREAERQWRMGNSFCYELKVPPSRGDDFFEIMKDDLGRYFGLITKVEKRKVPCLLLVRTGTEDYLKTKGGNPEMKESEEGNSLVIKNRSLKILVAFLAAKKPEDDLPIVDSSGYEGNIDLAIQANLSDFSAVRKELHRYGLDLIRSEAELDMLIISDKSVQK